MTGPQHADWVHLWADTKIGSDKQEPPAVTAFNNRYAGPKTPAHTLCNFQQAYYEHGKVWQLSLWRMPQAPGCQRICKAAPLAKLHQQPSLDQSRSPAHSTHAAMHPFVFTG